MGTTTTAPSTATTAPSMAPLPLMAGLSTMEPIVPIVVQIEAQDTPSVIQGAIQGARPVVSSEQTMQSTQSYGTLPYISGPPYTAPLPSTAPLPYAAYTAPLPSTAPLPYAAMPAMSARPTLPMGYYGQGNQFPFVPNPNWMFSEREQMLQQQLIQERQQFEAWRASQAQPQPQAPLVRRDQYRLEAMLRLLTKGQPVLVLRGLDQRTRSVLKLNVPGLLQHLADPPLPRGTTLGGLAQPQGHLRPVLNRLSIRLLLPGTLKPLS